MYPSRRSDARTPAVAIRTWMLGALIALLAAWPAAAFEAHTVFITGDLAIVDLESGEVVTIGDTGLLPVVSLARSPSGELFAVGKSPGIPELPWQLWTLDPATGAATLRGTVGPFTLALGDLTIDAAGGLWLALDGDLHTVDPASGEATPVGAPGGSLEALAARGGELYGIEETGLIGDRWRLVSVDETSGLTTPIALLPGLQDQDVLKMDFDAAGRLWILAVDISGIPEPPPATVFRLIDLGLGELEPVFDLGGSYEGWAISGLRAPIEIPVLDRHGLLLLAGLLLAAGLYGLRIAGGHRRPET